MLFPTIQFGIFFPIVFVGSWLLRPHPRRWKLFMLVTSYVFYGW
jgi:alginate O-acetyltransferase complex protein AlgI